MARSITENAVKIREEHGEHWCRDVESRGKDNAHVPDGHFVHIGIIHNLNQEK